MNPILIIYLVIACAVSIYAAVGRGGSFFPSFITGLIWPITVLFFLVLGIVGMIAENKKNKES